jgi:CLIP-associating protein 1/2
MNEAITLLASSQWSDRRDGILTIRFMMDNQRQFTPNEIKRLCEIFGRLFNDQHTKVFSLFLEALNEFLTIYKEHLRDWLFVLLTRLLIKQGGENLTSVTRKIIMCLETVRNSFGLDLQFKTLITFIKDNIIQTLNHKVKIAVLNYLQVLLCSMKSSDLHITEDLKFAVCRIVALTAEPKSGDLRKSAQSTLIALFNLNSVECSYLINQLPKNVHDSASQILNNHLQHYKSAYSVE